MISYIWGLPVYVGSFKKPEEAINELMKCESITDEANGDGMEPITDEANGDGMAFMIVETIGGELQPDEGTLFDLLYHGAYTTYIDAEVDEHAKQFMTELGIKNVDLTMNICGKPECSIGCSHKWFNTLKKGDLTNVHWHLANVGDPEFCQASECMFSFNYFAKYDPERDAKFHFMNPYPPVEMYTHLGDTFRRSVSMDVKEGDIVIFPSCMKHFVERQTVDATRITMSGNLYKVNWFMHNASDPSVHRNTLP